MKDEKHASQADVIKRTHDLVWLRDHRCRSCFGTRKVWFGDEMHEILPRSATRGMPPEERFNTHNCVRLCHLCHNDVTEKRIIIRAGADGADGLLNIIRRGDADEQSSNGGR